MQNQNLTPQHWQIASVDRSTLSPMLQEYFDLKVMHPDTIILFRLGDFFEAFFQDAQTIATVLDLPLFKRNADGNDRVPMAGFPYTALERYSAMLLNKGFKLITFQKLHWALSK
jgi:DNA mismatch repair protein MutS